MSANINIYKRALEIQDACNPVAVAGVLHDTAKHLLSLHHDTNMICTDPAMIVIIDKLCSLSGMQSYQHNILPVFAECERRSHEDQEMDS